MRTAQQRHTVAPMTLARGQPEIILFTLQTDRVQADYKPAGRCPG